MLETDLARDYYEVLEEAYFRPRENMALPDTYEQALENLLSQVKMNRIVIEQRDRAVKEKRWISEKREVTAMTTASIAVREKNKLAERLGEGKNYAAIIPVEKKLGKKFPGSLCVNGVGRMTPPHMMLTTRVLARLSHGPVRHGLLCMEWICARSFNQPKPRQIS